MGFDNLSPVAPARVHALLVPAGKVKRSRFAQFVSRIEEVKEVQLTDVSPNESASKSAFSPLAFPPGTVVYSISTSEVVSSSVESFPFELNREPQVVIALADGKELASLHTGEAEHEDLAGKVSLGDIQELIDELEGCKIRFRRTILWHMLVFDADSPATDLNDVSFVPHRTSSEPAAMRTIMCDITSLLLEAFDELSDNLQRFPTLESPRAISIAIAKDRVQHLTERSRQRGSLPSPTSNESKTPRSSPSPVNYLSHNNGIGTPTHNRRSGIKPSTMRLPAEQISRENSSDRNSGLESGGGAPPSPRLPTSKGRLKITIGAIKMQCGLWPDALKDLSEGVAIARANSDYLWQARGLEYVLVCMLLFVWKELRFEIPSICLPLNEKSSTESVTFYTPTGSASAPSTGKSLQSFIHNLAPVVPDVMNTILTLYQRASTFTSDKLPQLLFCEVRIRLVGLHSVIHLRGGTLDKHSIQHLIGTTSLDNNELRVGVSRKGGYRKDELSSMLIRAIPESSEDVKVGDTVRILVGISSILAKLRLGRKQAFILKEVLSTMMPGLIEARKVGAAEMGIHPAAGLSTLPHISTEGLVDTTGGVQPLLSMVSSMYAIPQRSILLLHNSSPSLEAIGENMRRWAYARQVGDAALKAEILKYCISICEAVPDFQGTLTFIVELFHTTRNAITLPPSHESGPPSIPADEQKRLLNIIKRTVETATRLGQKHIEADFWDDFLVRSVQPLSPADEHLITPHTPQDLVLAASSKEAVKRDPFIYSSFSKQLTKADIKPLLVVGEKADFAVILQNPFEFDLEIERISLLSEGSNFEASYHSIVLGPYSSQQFVLSGRPTAPGELTITGCRAKVRYCRERSFHIFSTSWMPEAITKLKSNHLQCRLPVSATSEQDSKQSSTKNPESETLSITVLEAQPSLSIIASTLSQSALMLLEGETKTFQITVKNTSPNVDVDFLIFSFQDSATTQLQDALGGRELSPGDVYELQLQLTGKPSLRWVPDNDNEQEWNIPAGETSTITFEVFGKSGLLNGLVQIDYTRIGVSRSELRNKFYTRQLRYPISFTVNGGIEIPRCNILPFNSDCAWTNQQHFDGEVPTNGDVEGSKIPAGSVTKVNKSFRQDGEQFGSLLAQLGLGHQANEHCLALLDLRNVWPHPISISVHVRESSGGSKAGLSDPWLPAYTIHEVLEPGYVSRVVLLLPRIFISNPYASIPLIGKQRQFVVSASKLSAETEAANREAFWFREELLKCVRGFWKEDSSGREGRIDLRRGIRLSPRMIDAMRIDEVEFDFQLTSQEVDTTFNDNSKEHANARPPVAKIGRSRFTLPTNMFAKLTVRIHNNSSNRIHIMLRLQPSVRNQPHSIALDLLKRFAWTGMLQRALTPAIEPGEIREAELGVMAHCEGDFEIGATAEEIVPAPRGPDEEIDDPLIPVKAKRRIWHAREPCLIDAVDRGFH